MTTALSGDRSDESSASVGFLSGCVRDPAVCAVAGGVLVAIAGREREAAVPRYRLPGVS